MIEQNKVYTLEFQNFRRVHRNRADGEIFCIELQVDESDWHYLSSFPQDAIGNAALQWTERATIEPPKRQPKPKPAPTPYGAFWRELDKTGFHNRPDVRQWIDYDGQDEARAKELIRQALGVERRSLEASPEMLITALRSNGMIGSAITAVETARRKAVQLQEAA